MALSLIVTYYFIDINANINFLINFLMGNIFLKLFLRGRCEISVISHRPLYCKNMLLKFVSRHFILILHSPVAIILLIILLTDSANSGANSLIIVFGKSLGTPERGFLAAIILL